MRWPGRLIASALVAACCMAAAPAKAEAVIYDTITDRTMSNSGVWVGWHPERLDSATMGVQFIATVGGAISSVKLSANGYSSGWLRIYSDNGGTIDKLLETIALTESPQWGTFATGGFAPYELVTGQAYWAVLTGAQNYWWFMNGPAVHEIAYGGYTDGYADFVTGGTYYDRVLTNPLGLQISVVPEPSTWAMLLLGFGALGVMARVARNGGRGVRASLLVSDLIRSGLPAIAKRRFPPFGFASRGNPPWPRG